MGFEPRKRLGLEVNRIKGGSSSERRIEAVKREFSVTKTEPWTL
jgi:hypothetical protein